YTLPPAEFLDFAEELDLAVIVGIDYPDWRYEVTPGRAATKRVHGAGLAAVEAAMELCSGRSEVLAVAVGNEVPGDVARTHGIRNVENVISGLIEAVHDADPEMLATYCNFPTTEYLQIRGQDLYCMNVFLEDPRTFRRYIRHLQVIADDRPLVMTELGLASTIHGEDAQAETLSWQLRTLDECGTAGATVFSWTDDWAVDDVQVDGWGFGVTDADRRPKLGLEALRRWAATGIRDLRSHWPRVSVVVCAYNAGRHIDDCLGSLAACDYPELEVIVCDDGSTDDTVERAGRFPFQIHRLDHGGLSRARNAGISAATGQIVAFLDADASCHPHWPYHLALSLEDEDLAGTGGPNLPFEDAGLVERAVAASPGGPIHVLVTDDRAEHVPGCNCAFRKSDLVAIDGFDPRYTTAGDDVDVCWKLLDADRDIAFSAAAQVRHHRRDTYMGYLRQQRGYGRAERMIAHDHRHRFNRLGQARWSGFIYGGPRLFAGVLRPLIYHGYQGMAPYQNVVHRRAEAARNWATALLPLVVFFAILGAALIPLSRFGLWAAVASVTIAIGYTIAVAVAAQPNRDEPHPLRYRALVASMYLIQPVVRAWGRLVTRREREKHRTVAADESWTGNRTQWLLNLENRLREKGMGVRIGGSHDKWDLDTSLGFLVAVRISVAVLWGWTPVCRTRLRLRPAGYLVVAFAGLSAAFGYGWQSVVLGAALVLGLFETYALRRILTRAIGDTTHGAGR
ncbi:MAG: glycosyltransferase, partial [Actinomycetota bacterium]